MNFQNTGGIETSVYLSLTGSNRNIAGSNPQISRFFFCGEGMRFSLPQNCSARLLRLDRHED